MNVKMALKLLFITRTKNRVTYIGVIRVLLEVLYRCTSSILYVIHTQYH